MFHLVGQIVRRGWPLFLLGWGFLLLASRYAAPPWEQVAQDKEFAFLPESCPSRQAETIFARAFPEDRLGSSIVLVLHHSGGEQQYLDSDLKLISEVLEPGLRQIAEGEGGLAYEVKPSEEPLFPGEEASSLPQPQPQQRSIIARIRTPNIPGAGALLVSPDEQEMLVVVELTTELVSTRNWQTIDKINGFLADLRDQGKVPLGFDITVTGSAVIGRDHTLAQLQSIRATGVLTVVLVVVLLLLIYRAPLLALIPLATVYLAVQVATNLLAILAGHGYLTLFQGIQIYITILAYGAGVDYCLFLTARYREELDRGASPADAIARAIGGVGAALTASAATVMFGIGMMAFAQFGKFREAGLAIPLALALVLCATLTFSPSLLRLAGRWAFWPRRPGEKSLPVANERPLSWTALFQPGELERIWDRVGQLLLRRAGAVWLATVAVMAPFAVAAALLGNRLSYDLIGSLPPDAPSVAGTRLLQEHFPAGTVGPMTVLVVNPHVDFSSASGRAGVAGLTDRLREQREELGLADVRSLTAPLGITAAAGRDFSGLHLSAEARREGTEQAALAHYVAGLQGRYDVTRFDLVMNQSPFSTQSVSDLEQINRALQDALPADVRPDSALHFVGATASVRDLATVMRQDRTRIEWLVLASVLVILVLLLRRLVVPIYLLLSVLFSYYTTLGVTFVVFWLIDPHGFTGLDWKVVLFLFTILIAVGEDYNILLMARVDEEERRHGPVRGVTEALDRTGPIISSCGIIMAGTFGSLLAGSLAEMKQLGFALAFGVLLDTFVVRPILVPAFLILLHGGPRPGSRQLSVSAERSKTSFSTLPLRG
jgi:RND superfamily putative drug exporter